MFKSGCYECISNQWCATTIYFTMCGWGRAITNPTKKYHVKKKMADFDACPLYPTAMFLMLGFLMGLQKALTNISYDFVKSHDGYLIRLAIIKLNKHSDSPLTSENQ